MKLDFLTLVNKSASKLKIPKNVEFVLFVANIGKIRGFTVF